MHLRIRTFNIIDMAFSPSAAWGIEAAGDILSNILYSVYKVGRGSRGMPCLPHVLIAVAALLSTTQTTVKGEKVERK